MSTDNLVVKIELKEETINKLNDKYASFIVILEEKTKKEVELRKAYEELKTLNDKAQILQQDIAAERINIRTSHEEQIEEIYKEKAENKKQKSALIASYVVNIILFIIASIIIGYFVYKNKERFNFLGKPKATLSK